MYLHMVRLIPKGVGGRVGWREKLNLMDIHLYGYKIHNWRYGGIESKLRVIVQANMDLRVLYKTKITFSVYMRHSLD